MGGSFSRNLSVLFPAKHCKAEADEHDGCAPRERERVIEHWKRWRLPENSADPDDTKRARAKHRTERRIQRVSAAAQDASWYLIQITKRLIEQNAQNSYSCAPDNRGVRRKKPRKRIAEQDDHKNRHSAARKDWQSKRPRPAPPKQRRFCASARKQTAKTAAHEAKTGTARPASAAAAPEAPRAPWKDPSPPQRPPRPMCPASSTFAPMESPEETVTISAMISVFVPTAASASAFSRKPTTTISAALKSCCTMLLSATGSVNASSFPARPPCSISISASFKRILSRPFLVLAVSYKMHYHMKIESYRYFVSEMEVSVGKSTRGFSQGKTTSGVVILVNGRQRSCCRLCGKFSRSSRRWRARSAG